MHPDLSPHLHTPECNAIIEALHNCHIEIKAEEMLSCVQHPYRKFIGHCNSIDAAMTRCLNKERREKQIENKKRAEKMREKIIAAQRSDFKTSS